MPYRLLLHEYITGGGCWTVPFQLGGSLLCEGEAMLRAVATDLAAIDGVQLEYLRDSRLPPLPAQLGTAHVVTNAADESRILNERAAAVDAVLLIAPEIGGALADRAARVEQLGGRLVSPGSKFIAVASDKHATAERLARAGVPVPLGIRLSAADPLPADFPYPAVLKPVDGAGSLAVRRVESSWQAVDRTQSAAWRLEQFVAGRAASVAVLCGPAERVPLPAFEQRLGGSGEFAYLGGAGPLRDDENHRAAALAAAAVRALPATVGYVGVDLVLGADASGGADRVIEINPRLTTSYVGLRALCRQNVAAAMLAVADGRSCALSFRGSQVEFDADGTVTSRVE